MHFKHIVSVVACCFIIKFGFVKSEHDESDGEPAKSKEEIEVEEDMLGDGHTFVALIDVVFPDGTKRTCTGTIIHDNVVITAAHCFVHETDDEVQPELTASFVVIGTRKMYEAGYEHYLPIERIITHPKYDGWTADLSLVYTFAGMTSDKPGKIIKIAGEKLSNSVDSNLTVYSWGHTKSEEVDDDKVDDKFKGYKMTPCGESSSDEQDNQMTVMRVDSKRARLDSFFPVTQRIKQRPIQLRAAQKGVDTEIFRESVLYKFPTLRDNVKRGKEKLSHYPLEWQSWAASPKSRVTSPEKMSRYLTSDENTDQEGIAIIYFPQNSQDKRNETPRLVQSASVPFKGGKVRLPFGYEGTTKPPPRQTTSTRTQTINRNWRRSIGTQVTQRTKQSLIQLRDDVERGKENISKYPLKSHPGAASSPKKMSRYLTSDENTDPFVYEGTTKPPPRQTTSTKTPKTINKNWRRSMGTQENKLLVKDFAFVNTATCKNIVESVLAPRSEFKSGEVACYSNVEHYLTDDDSGAPAISHSQLVAVTVGGAEFEGDHAGVGMRMSCYCSWISDNLPGGGKMNCCKNCCDVKHTESASDPQKLKDSKRKRKNKYLT